MPPAKTDVISFKSTGCGNQNDVSEIYSMTQPESTQSVMGRRIPPNFQQNPPDLSERFHFPYLPNCVEELEMPNHTNI